MIVTRIARVTFEVNRVARFVDATFGEKEDAVVVRAILVVVGRGLGNAEAIERERILAGVERDQMRIVPALREDPTRLVVLREVCVSGFVGDRFAQNLAFPLEQLQAQPGIAFACGERKEMEECAAVIAFPDRAQVGQLHQRLCPNAFSFGIDRINRLRG